MLDYCRIYFVLTTLYYFTEKMFPFVTNSKSSIKVKLDLRFTNRRGSLELWLHIDK